MNIQSLLSIVPVLGKVIDYLSPEQSRQRQLAAENRKLDALIIKKAKLMKRIRHAAPEKRSAYYDSLNAVVIDIARVRHTIRRIGR